MPEKKQSAREMYSEWLNNRNIKQISLCLRIIVGFLKSIDIARGNWREL